MITIHICLGKLTFGITWRLCNALMQDHSFMVQYNDGSTEVVSMWVCGCLEQRTTQQGQGHMWPGPVGRGLPSIKPQIWTCAWAEGWIVVMYNFKRYTTTVYLKCCVFRDVSKMMLLLFKQMFQQKTAIYLPVCFLCATFHYLAKLNCMPFLTHLISIAP